MMWTPDQNANVAADRPSGQNVPVATDERTSEDSHKMSVAEIVERYGVSERTARRHRARGTLPSEDRRKFWRRGKIYTMPAESTQKRKFTYAHSHLVAARNNVRNAKRSAYVDESDLAIAMQLYDQLATIDGRMGCDTGAGRRDRLAHIVLQRNICPVVTDAGLCKSE